MTGRAAQQVEAVAVRAVGGGQATKVERGDHDAAYEVEVRKPDGSQVEVGLDENFQPLGTEDEEDEEEP